MSAIIKPKLETPNTKIYEIFFNPATLLLLLLAFLLYIDMQLSADGVEHLRLTLNNKGVFTVNEARSHAYWLLQWPVEIALKLEAKQLNTYISAFAAGVFFILCAPWILFSLLIKDRNYYTSLCYIYVLALASVTLPSIYILGTDHQVIMPLVIMVSFLLSRLKKNPISLNILALVLLFLLCKTYETNLFPLSLISVYLGYTAYKKAIPKQTLVIIAIGICICSFGIYESVMSILHPRDAANRDSFVGAVVHSVNNPVLITFLFVIAASLAFQWRRSVAALFLAAGIAYQAYCYITPGLYQVAAGMSFASRTLTLLFPAIFSFIILTKTKLKLEKLLTWTSTIILIISTLILAYPFYDFKQKVITKATETSGFIEAEQHGLSNHPAAWPWTFPTISMFWQAPCVSSVLLNQNPKNWQPYKPKEITGLEQFLAYKPWMYTDNNKLARCQ